jgi:hypothetical protein
LLSALSLQKCHLGSAQAAKILFLQLVQSLVGIFANKLQKLSLFKIMKDMQSNIIFANLFI